jgi:peptide/nickel transport system permease protein
MARIILGRLVSLVPILLGVSLLTFVALHVIPGDVAVLLVGQEGVQDPQVLANIRHVYGLDKPLPVQYGLWVERAARGDLGTSLRLKVPVRDEILRRLPLTMEIASYSVVYALIVGGALGVLAATRGKGWALLTRTYTLLGVAIPSFFLATLLVLFGSRYLPFIPTLQYVPFSEDPRRHLMGLIYPVLSLGTGLAAVIAENTWSSVSEAMRLDHVRVSRAKGLRERAVIFHHVLRNALIPIVTVAGLQTAYLLGGTVIVETIFALPGLGRLAYSAITLRDYPLMLGIVLVVAVLVVLTNLAADLLYAVLDPRIRVG